MRSKIDASLERRTKRKKFKSPPGGKALQRLFFYFGQRDPALTDDVVETLPVAKAALPQFGVTKRASRAKATTAPRGARASFCAGDEILCRVDCKGGHRAHHSETDIPRSPRHGKGGRRRAGRSGNVAGDWTIAGSQRPNVW